LKLPMMLTRLPPSAAGHLKVVTTSWLEGWASSPSHSLLAEGEEEDRREGEEEDKDVGLRGWLPL
jgi:hypothetical protein